MKLRVRDNSIRLRLTRSEVQQILSVGLVKASVPFSAGVTLDYILEGSPACIEPTAHFSNSALTVCLPEEAAKRWADSEQVSISAQQILDDGQSLNILIEKDFTCLAPRDGEDESDMFPHPDEDK